MKRSQSWIPLPPMLDSRTLLLDILQRPERIAELDESAWDLLIRQARHANLLGRLAWIFEQKGLLEELPGHPRNHLISVWTVATRQHQALRQEAGLLREALEDKGIPLILLKGAAYVLAGLPAAPGRIFADIDILVPKERLPEAESALMLTGWSSGQVDPYDERYYRTWMHELPPMQHIFRKTSLDVHHTILPPTSELKIDPVKLIEASIELPGSSRIRVLSPCDMVLHSATHLFHEGEADNLLRDLSDLDLLLRHFSEDVDFWPRLLKRAQTLDLVWPLGLACRYTSSILGTHVPLSITSQAGVAPEGGLKAKLHDAIYRRVLRPQHPSTEDAGSAIARKMLYIRAHWLRMPMHLLAYHLAHKLLFPPEAKSVPLAAQLDPRDQN